MLQKLSKFSKTRIYSFQTSVDLRVCKFTAQAYKGVPNGDVNASQNAIGRKASRAPRQRKRGRLSRTSFQKLSLIVGSCLVSKKF